jgi:uncharacterized membrane protein
VGDGLDAEALVRACSRGFTVLVAGGLLSPLASRVPVVGGLWLAVVAIVAFAVAGMRIGKGRRPALQGAGAAAGSYALVLPLVFLGGGGTADAWQVVLTLVVAIVAGGLAGLLAARRRKVRA